jgi:aryl-alcohol dehydrogenase-like predicted oxidoreductase
LKDKGINLVGLSRKHIIEGTRHSLKLLQLDYVDLIYAHRSDQFTPLDETCRAFSWVIEQGLAHYWELLNGMPTQSLRLFSSVRD